MSAITIFHLNKLKRANLETKKKVSLLISKAFPYNEAVMKGIELNEIFEEISK